MFKIKIEKIPARHILEREDRYGVLLNGNQVGELYYNMTGYRGALPTVSGAHFDIGERGISAWKKLAAELNREAKHLERIVSASPMKFSSISPTIKGDVVRLDFHSDETVQETLFVSRRAAHAGLELLGYDGLAPEFFPIDERHDPLGAPESERICGWQDNVGNTRFVLDHFETDRVDCIAVLVGYVPPSSLKRAQDGEFGPDWDCNDLKSAFGMGWAEGAERLVFVDADCFNDLQTRHERSFMKAQHLPGQGVLSSYGEVFSPAVTSTRERPAVRMPEHDQALYSDVLARAAIRFDAPEQDLAVNSI